MYPVNNGQYPQGGYGAQPGQYGGSFSPTFNQGYHKDIEGGPLLFDGDVRKGFIRKVYSILSVQLTFTAAICALPFFSERIRDFQRSPIGIGLLILAMITSIICVYMVFCYMNIARRVPVNFFILLIFTTCEAYMVSFSTSQYKLRIVLMAFALTAVATISLTLYALTTKSDFTTCGGILFVIGALLLVFGLVLIFMRSAILDFIYSCLIVILYSFYLIYDTQLIAGGKKYELSLDDYIIGAMLIYVDIIVLFLEILKLLGNRE
eukprot:TRINITY_DN888_c0_g1_i1.p1 TRINITY_DN888_c0_g1~~TRINITY_DN888_c0_g1_i1.p1  ORF type:complete len:264 (+),score=26.05 TRINITY_DN888_c0_g1_i1:56-847(+)